MIVNSCCLGSTLNFHVICNAFVVMVGGGVMLPEWDWPYLRENYTGPYLSDGKFQQSVAHGRAAPNSQVDQLSRDHDTAYALAKNDADRRKADRLYYLATRRMSMVPRLFGNLVLYGNDPALLFDLDGGGVNYAMGNALQKDLDRNERKQNLRRRDAFAGMYGEEATTLFYDPLRKNTSSVYNPQKPGSNDTPTPAPGGRNPNSGPKNFQLDDSCTACAAGEAGGYYGIGGFRPGRARKRRRKRLY